MAYNHLMKTGEDREREWLAKEVERAAHLSDADRIRILRDLLSAAEAIRRTKSAEQIEREEEVRRVLETLPGRARYEATAERLE